MNKLNELKDFAMPYLASIKEILFLYSELIAVLLAATVLGWLVGTMMQRGRSKKALKNTVSIWEKRYTTLEDTARADAENLEEQLQTIAKESKSLQDTNKALSDSLKKNDSGIQKARAESIELNRQHAETQERLQRIIQQKDREIVQLADRVNQTPNVQAIPKSTHVAPNVSPTINSRFGGADENDLNNADTIAISPKTNAEAFDATVQLSNTESLTSPARQNKAAAEKDLDMSMDDTADLGQLASGDDLEESTIALDDEALAFAQRSYPKRRGE